MIFVWLGSELPEYGKFCIQSFKKINPDFEVMLVNEPDMSNIQNEDLKDCIRLVESEEYNIYKHMVCRPWAISNLMNTSVGRITALSDAFRLYLLNKHGGIYIDIDAFPVKPFDDQLLSYAGFTINNIKWYYDYFFMGFSKDCIDVDQFIRVPQNNGAVFDVNRIHIIRYSERLFRAFKFKRDKIVEKFLAGTLQFGETLFDKRLVKDYYIDHFRLNTWCPLSNQQITCS